MLSKIIIGIMKTRITLMLLVVLSILTINCPLMMSMGGPPQAVFVDDDYTSSTPGWGFDHFSGIQGAIDAVGENGMVHIGPGSYYNDMYPISIRDRVLSIYCDKGCTILGDGVHDVFHISGSDVCIAGCTISGGKNAIVSVGSLLNLQDNMIAGNGRNGIAAYNSTFTIGELLLSNNIIVGNGGDGIVAYSFFLSMTGLQLFNNVLSDNLGNGLAVMSFFRSESSGTVINSIITKNGSFGISDPVGMLQLNANDVWGNTHGNYLGDDLTGQSENISKDPLFSAPGNYHLSYGSPCMDSGISAYGNPSHDIEGIDRPQGRGCDIGAYEAAVITILQISDLHLLAPLDQELTYGRGYETYIWEGFEDLMGEIVEKDERIGIDLVIVTGDLVNWATDSTTYNTILGETYVVTEWENTYEGYLLFKELLLERLGNVPIFETVGNHDYREHPYQFWTWSDKTGIDEGFLLAMNYADYSYIEVSSLLDIPLNKGIIIHIMNSGCDRIGSLDLRDRILLPYLAINAENYDELRSTLENAGTSSSLAGFLEDLAYGSGFDDGQLQGLSSSLAKHGNDINLVFDHYPIVYPKITITNNIGEFLDLCRSYGVALVSGGHTHQNQSIDVDWSDGPETTFMTVGSAIDGAYCLIHIMVGSVGDGQTLTIVPVG